MTHLPKILVSLVALAILPFAGLPSSLHAQVPDSTSGPPAPLVEVFPDTIDSDVPYVPTPQPVVNRMLQVANVDSTDLVYDLGSGDGRIVITAAKKFGARGVGIDIDPKRVKEARANAREAGVTDRVEFRRGDLFEADFSEATVVTLYLLTSVNLKLRPMLFEQLEPGTPIVSHDFDMGDWEPERTIEMGSDTIYLWTIPEEVPEHFQEEN